MPYTPHWYASLELASEENFDEQNYLAANPDLREAKQRDDSFDLAGHFRHYGKRERRMQCVTRNANRMADKFQRFRSALKLAHSRFLAEPETFPIAYGSDHLALDDYVAESANANPPAWDHLLKADPQGRYLDLGCGFRNIVYDNCLYLEVYPSRTADIVIVPGAPLPLQDGMLDGLGCFAVLEHVEDPFFVASEISRVMRAGGRIFVDWPFLQPVHGYPSHYFNATRAGLVKAFEASFEIDSITTDSSQGADFTLSWVLNWFLEGLQDDAVKREIREMTVGDLAMLKPQDEVYRRCLQAMTDDMRMKLACGNRLIGTRK